MARTDSHTVMDDPESEDKEVLDNVELNVEEIESIEFTPSNEKIDPSNQSI